MEIIDYTRERIPEVVDFERRLREEEPFYSWEIDEAYQKRVEGAAIHDEGIWIDL